MLKVTALSVSVPRTVEINGRPTVTSIVHDPYAGPLSFGVGGPVGNSTAVHTEEVLAMVAENYDHWAAYLDIPREQWTDCFWGENITIGGLSENTLRIGDRLRVGSAAVFEVTSPPHSVLQAQLAAGATGPLLEDGDPIRADRILSASGDCRRGLPGR